MAVILRLNRWHNLKEKLPIGKSSATVITRDRYGNGARAAADYQDIAALSEVGTARENYAQQQINADVDRYNYDANRDALGLQNYANLIQGNYGMSGSSTSTGQTRNNPLGGILSGALAGGGMGMNMSQSGWGGLLGAGLGGLLGFF